MPEGLEAVSVPPPATPAQSAAQLGVLRGQLLRYARLVVHEPALAEDLVQDTLLAVLQQQHTHRGDGSLRTWSVGILKHKVADWYRAPARRREFSLDDDSELLAPRVEALYDESGRYRDPVAPWPQPDDRAQQHEMMQAIETCLGALPAQTRRVFMMRDWLGFETAEICERVGISADNCRTILHRARMALRGCLQREWGAHPPSALKPQR